MRLLTLPLLAIALLCAAPVLAQQGTPAQPLVAPTLDERSALASTLKDLHGELSEQLQAVSKLAGEVDRIAAPKLLAIQKEIEADLGAVEKGLDRISQGDDASFQAARKDTEQLAKDMRATVDARNKGLAEAYGGR